MVGSNQVLETSSKYSTGIPDRLDMECGREESRMREQPGEWVAVD